MESGFRKKLWNIHPIKSGWTCVKWMDCLVDSLVLCCRSIGNSQNLLLFHQMLYALVLTQDLNAVYP